MIEKLKEAILYTVYIDYWEEDYTRCTIENFRESFESGLSSEHFGDCTKHSCPCLRCACENIKKDADYIIDMFTGEQNI